VGIPYVVISAIIFWVVPFTLIPVLTFKAISLIGKDENIKFFKKIKKERC
jgi:hypothetical protein